MQSTLAEKGGRQASAIAIPRDSEGWDITEIRHGKPEWLGSSPIYHSTAARHATSQDRYSEIQHVWSTLP